MVYILMTLKPQAGKANNMLPAQQNSVFSQGGPWTTASESLGVRGGWEEKYTRVENTGDQAHPQQMNLRDRGESTAF